MLNIHVTSHFMRGYKKLPKEIKELLGEKEDIFINNPLDSRLKTHKLTGKQEGLWAFSINYKFRVIFSFKDSENVLLYAVGDHDIYE